MENPAPCCHSDFGPTSTEVALLALERASSSEPSGVPEDMAFLIELVQGSKSRSERWRQAAALMGLRSILLCKHQAVRMAERAEEDEHALGSRAGFCFGST